MSMEQPELSGWHKLVLERTPRGEFTSADLYVHEEEFRSRYPGNENVQAKIRQVLQDLRDRGLIQLTISGKWQRVDTSSSRPPDGRSALSDGPRMTGHVSPQVQADLVATHARALEAGELLSPERVEADCARFRQLFGPEILRQLDGEALLERMHGTGNKENLTYWLEFKDDDEFATRSFGVIFGGSAAKFGLYRTREGQWVTGAGKRQRVLSLAEAVARARQHRDQIMRGVAAIERLDDRRSDEAYRALQHELDEVAPDLVDTAWGHKYFALLFPHVIDSFHVRPYQDWNLLCLLQRPPEAAGRFVCAGRFVAIAELMGWSLLTTMQVLSRHNGRPLGHYLVDVGHLGREGLEGQLARSAVALPGVKADDLRDLPSDGWKEALRQRVSLAFPDLDGRELGRRTTELGWFVHDVEHGDQVLVAQGQEVLAVGRLTGDYAFVAEDQLPHQRIVEWLNVRPFTLASPESIGGIFDYVARPENIIAVRTALLDPQLPGPPPPPPPPAPDKDSRTAAPQPPRRRTVPPLGGIRGRIQAILDRKGQAILYGPPGTGKTHWAERTACDLAAWEEHGKHFEELDEAARNAIRGPTGRVRLCTFHPAFGYEDFIEGYRPEPKVSGMSFERRDGVFKRLCRDAAALSERWTHFLIVDEINRGDVPRIFGELLTLLELDKRNRPSVLPSGESFNVPTNVRVIGTMNTADRSIALLDAALRRRFGFVELMPDVAPLRNAVIKPALPLGLWLQRLNRRILQHVKRDARNLQIGHAYFLDRGQPIESTTRFVQILREDVIPLLEEYCYADFRALAELVGDKLVDAENQRIRDELFTAERAIEVVEHLLALDPDLASGVPGDEDETTKWDSDLSNEDLMRRLVSEGKSDTTIHEVFRKRYAARGRTDDAWVNDRIATYRRIADKTLPNSPAATQDPPPEGNGDHVVVEGQV